MVLRLLIAALLGGIIGYERERAQKPAGFRTLLLVCLGSTLFTIMSVHGFSGFGMPTDPARIASNIVAGIGFLGAGTILRGEGAVVGLTTAATIWVLAAIGMAVGTGYYLIAVVTSAIAFIVLRLPAHLR